MGKGAVRRAIRASIFKQMLFGFLLLGGVVLGLILGGRYLVNFFSGPRPISAAEMDNITDLDKVERYWVMVKGDLPQDTGWEQKETTYFIQTSVEHYIVMLVGERVLLVTLPYTPKEDEDLPVNYTGSLQRVPSDIDAKVLADLRSSYPKISSLLLPYMLNTSDFRTSGFIGLAIALFTVAGAGFLIIRATLLMGTPARHAIYRSLARYGNPDEVADQVNADMSQKHPVFGANHITPNWVIVRSWGGLKTMNLSEVVWIYQHVTRHRVNGIRSGNTYKGIVLDKRAYNLELTGRKKQVERAMKEIATAVPHIVVGYSPQIVSLWSSQRAEFLAAVEQSRQKNTAPTAEAVPMDSSDTYAEQARA